MTDERNAQGACGVLLLNLGGPDSIGAVRPFLYNLFSDREIIRLGPPFMQRPLAYLISVLRHKKTEGYYRLIGGKSPILDITNAQARKLEEALNSSRTGSAGEAAGADTMRVYVGMRYWSPFIEETVARMQGDGISRCVVVSLYPQYSIATTGSSLARLHEVLKGSSMQTVSISSWFDHPLYIEAMVSHIRKGLESFAPAEDVQVLFSAHSLPVKFIKEGDPYADQIRQTIALITKRLDVGWDLSFQSKSGPVEWLGPSTDEKIVELARRGVKNLLVVPISFVSDHIETLYEIDILYKSMAQDLGVRLERMESLNTSSLFIEALKDIVEKRLAQCA